MEKIMFNDKYGLTQAVVDLIKTNTRRAEKSLDVLPLDYNPLLTEFQFEYKDGIIIGQRFFKGSHAETYHLKPRYKIGEVVAVSQAYKETDERGIVGYEDVSDIQPGMVSPIFAKQSAGWNNKMFVRADLMPFHIRITNIKVERLQDISDEDAMREGVFKYDKPPLHHEADMFAPWAPHVRPYKFDSDNLVYRCTARYAFAYLIDKISGGGTWNRNPWVFAYEFELIK